MLSSENELGTWAAAMTSPPQIFYMLQIKHFVRTAHAYYFFSLHQAGLKLTKQLRVTWTFSSFCLHLQCWEYGVYNPVWFYGMLGTEPRATTETEPQAVRTHLNMTVPKDRARGSELCVSWLTVSRSPGLHPGSPASCSLSYFCFSPYSLARAGKAW